MKISYRTHPILKKIEEGRLGKIGLFPEDQLVTTDSNFIQNVSGNFKLLVPSFKKNVDVISKTFIDAAILAKDKMIADDIWNDIESTSGTIINFYGYDICYILERLEIFDKKTGLRLYREVFFMFLKDIFVLYAINHESGSHCWCSKRVENMFGRLMKNSSKADIFNEVHLHYKTLLISLLNFIKYAPVEVKNLTAKSRKKDFLCKYINETMINMRILESTWFTTLVKSEAFKVRGHFRLQPCGQAFKDKKLIWITEFKKHGYTAPARKISLLN